MSTRFVLTTRSNYITRKVKMAGQRWRRLSVQTTKYQTEIFIRQNIGPLIKSLAEELPQNTQQEESSVKEEDS